MFIELLNTPERNEESDCAMVAVDGVFTEVCPAVTLLERRVGVRQQ